MNTLPLSWSICDTENLTSTSIRNWKVDWLAIQNVSSPFIAKQLIKNDNGKETLIRGCNNVLKNELEHIGYSSLLVGYEAILDLRKNPLKRRSLKELVKRGKRFGKVIKVPYTPINSQKLRELQKDSSHSREPQLKNLFQMEFKSNNFLYVFIDNYNNWLGAIMLSKNSNLKLHTELLLRRHNAPNGIMEALVEKVSSDARNNNYSYLSLGEVPFIRSVYENGNLYSKVLYVIGKSLSFAYNYDGLYNFKNKFKPIWVKVYICSSHKVGFRHLFFIFIHSNFHKLAAYKLLYGLKNKLSVFFCKKKKKITSHNLTLIRPSCNFYPIK